MRYNPASLFFAAAIALAVCFQGEATAKDDYSTHTLKPGHDAGTLAQTPSSFTIRGKQLMVRCSSYSTTAKLCSSTTCSATIDDTPIDADKSIDICSVTDDTTLSLFRTYDGGVPNCRVYTVNPKTICPP